MRRILLIALLFCTLGSDRSSISAEPSDAPAAPNKLDLKYVPADAFALSVIEPHRLLTGPQRAVYDFLLQSIGGKKELGFDPNDIEQAMVIVGLPDPNNHGGPPHVGFVVRYVNSFDQTALGAKIAPRGADNSWNGCQVRINHYPYQMSCAFPDDKTVLIARNNELIWLLQAKSDQSPLQKLAAETDDSPQWQLLIDVTHIRPEIKKLLDKAETEHRPLPVWLLVLAKYQKNIDTLTANLSEAPHNAMQFNAVAVSPNETAAKELATDVKHVLAMIHDELVSDKAPPQVTAQIRTMSDKAVQALQPTQEGNRVNFHADFESGPTAAGAAVALLLPAVQAAREAVARNHDANNLKQLALALLNYEDQYRRLPAQAICDKNGKPLLSWRVAVLPQLEENDLYKEFHLDEPWDSEHNKALIEKMPDAFKHPKFDDPGKTVYQVVYGKGGAFEGSEGTMLKSFTDGTSKTVVVVESTPENAVPWTKPEDWTLDDNDPKKGIGILFSGGISNMVFADGHVKGFVFEDLDPAIWKAILTRNGGELVNIP